MPLTGLEGFEGHRTDLQSDQPQHGHAERSQHAAHLAVASLGQNHLKPRAARIPMRGDRRRSGRWYRRERAVQIHQMSGTPLDLEAGDTPCSRPLKHRVVRLRLDLYQVALLQPKVGLCDACLQAAVVRQQQQTFGIEVESPSWINVRNIDEVSQGRPLIDASELAQNTKRFMESDQHGGYAAEFVVLYSGRNAREGIAYPS